MKKAIVGFIAFPVLAAAAILLHRAWRNAAEELAYEEAPERLAAHYREKQQNFPHYHYRFATWHRK